VPPHVIASERQRTLGDIDPDDCRKFLNGVGYAEREPPQHYSHGYGQWWDSPAGGPAFIPWNPSTNKVAGAAICEVAQPAVPQRAVLAP
jgi:hypothetical protein